VCTCVCVCACACVCVCYGFVVCCVCDARCVCCVCVPTALNNYEPFTLFDNDKEKPKIVLSRGSAVEAKLLL